MRRESSTVIVLAGEGLLAVLCRSAHGSDARGHGAFGELVRPAWQCLYVTLCHYGRGQAGPQKIDIGPRSRSTELPSPGPGRDPPRLVT
jgi:hypothetical protein